MPKLHIKGWDTGRNKVAMMELLQETLGMNKEESEKLADAIHQGKGFKLVFEDMEEARELADKLTAVGAKVEIESE